MKKTLLALALFSIGGNLFAQTKAKPVKKTVATPAGPSLKTALDSFSYSLGLSFAEFYKQQGISNINTTLLNKGINDAMKTGQKPLLTEEQMNTSITGYLQQLKAEKALASKRAGQAFLANNKSKPGVTTLASGLQYQVLKEGSGEKPTVNDRVRCHYHGTLIDGTVFDSSVERGQPAEFSVGGVIRGWVEALQLMPVGSKWRLFIPSDLAYGDNAAGPQIKPGSTLIFDVELLEILK